MREELLRGLLERVDRIRRKLKFQLIIVCGSVARGEYVENLSDIDLIIVDERFKEIDFWSRISSVIEYFDIGVPVDVLCFTPEEFINQLRRLNFFVLDAIEFGIPLPRASAIYSKARRVLEELKKKHGLKPTTKGWRFHIKSECRE